MRTSSGPKQTKSKHRTKRKNKKKEAKPKTTAKVAFNYQPEFSFLGGAILGPPRTKPEIPVITFLLPFFFSFNNKIFAETPILWCFSKPKKRFSKVELKAEETKKTIAPLLWKRLLWENWQITGHNKKHKMITEQKQITWNHYKYGSKITLDQITTLTWTR